MRLSACKNDCGVRPGPEAAACGMGQLSLFEGGSDVGEEQQHEGLHRGTVTYHLEMLEERDNGMTNETIGCC
jgi:hypothetical protein